MEDVIRYGKSGTNNRKILSQQDTSVSNDYSPETIMETEKSIETGLRTDSSYPNVSLTIITFASLTLGSFLFFSKFVYLFCEQQQLFIYRIPKIKIRIQYTRLPVLTFVSKSLGAFLISPNLFTYVIDSFI